MKRDYSKSLFSADFMQRNYPKAVAASVDFKSLKNNPLASGTTDRQVQRALGTYLNNLGPG